MKSAHLSLKSCVSACALLAFFSTPLAAQGVETILVTAQKREQALQDVSAAITAVTAERLQDAHISNIEDLQAIVPSIHLGNDFHMAKTFIRGVGANTSTTGSETGVALHVDGAFVPRAEAQLTSLFDLERVEVLRGPQGTVYGRNAVGGAINLITAKPTREFEGYGHISVGNYKNINGDGAVGGALTDTLLARAAFKIERRGGFGINPATGNDVDDLSRAMARLHLNWVPSDAFDILLSGEYYTQQDASSALKFRSSAFPNPVNPSVDLVRLFPIGAPSTTPGVVGGFAVAPRDLASEHDPATETHAWAVTATTNWKVNDHITLTNISSFRDSYGFINADLDISSRINGATVPVSSPPTPAGNNNSSAFRRDVKSEQYGTEQQFKYNSDWLNSVLGVFYLHEVQDPVDTVGFGPVLGEANIFPALLSPGTAPSPFPPISATGLQIDGINIGPPVSLNPIPLDYAHFVCNSGEYLGKGTTSTASLPPKRVCIKSHLTTDAWAVFGQFNVKLAETLALKLGARYSHESASAQSASIIVARNGIGPVLITTGAGNFNQRNFNAFSPEAGIEWSPTEDLLVYYTYSKGFKAGAGENNQGPVTAAVGFRSVIVGPEIIENHEAGLKSEWFDNRLLVNIAGFTYDLRGQQINKTLSGGAAGFSTIFENAAQTSAKGVELEFTGLITDDFRVSGSVNWLDSKYTDFLTIDPLVPQNVTTGGPPVVSCPAADPGITWPTSCAAIPGFVVDPRAGTINLAGNPTRDSPKWSANFHAEYDIRGMNIFGDGYLTPAIDVMYKSDVFFTEFARLLEGQAAYTIIDGNIRYTSGNERLTADLWIKNATDKLVASSTFQLATGRVIGVTYLPPRMIGFTVGYKF